MEACLGAFLRDFAEAGTISVSVQYGKWFVPVADHVAFFADGVQLAVVPRPIPGPGTSFAIQIDETSWSYWENGVEVQSFPSTFLDRATEYQILIGGYDGSTVAQEMVFGPIRLTDSGSSAVPEPGTLIVASLWGGVLWYRRQRKGRRHPGIIAPRA